MYSSVVGIPKQDEVARIREVQKFKCVSVDGVTQFRAPSTTLTALLQLVAVRLDAQRALISFVDKDHQCFVAEATPTSDLRVTAKEQDLKDELWMGCTGSTPRSQALCANTIIADDVTNSYPSFVVNDLSVDPRFRDLPYVRTGPCFRFYAGTPLIARNGLRVGSLFIIEDKPRYDFNDANVQWLGFMAEAIMKQFELEREFERQWRFSKMTQGLASLVAHSHSTVISSEVLNSDPADSIYKSNGNLPNNHLPIVEHSANSTSSRSLGHRASPTAVACQNVLANAAKLLRQCMSVDKVIFTDIADVIPGVEIDAVDINADAKSDLSDVTSPAASLNSLLDRASVARFRIQYPNGKIWTLDDDDGGNFATLSTLEAIQLPISDLSKPDVSEVPSSSRECLSEIEETRLLRCAFPKAKQIIFTPLWNTSDEKGTSACFVIANDIVPVMSEEVDMKFVRAFVNSLGVVCGHMIIKLAAEQKSHFVSSMSHELRSPLHGIVASSELLASSQLDANQRALCNNIETCGQALLDTITQVLEHTKLNDFTQQLPNSIEPSEMLDGSVRRFSIHEGSSLRTNSNHNIASLCEEAFDIVKFSYTKYVRARDGTDDHLQDLHETLGGQSSSPYPVDLYLQIAPGDWNFPCNPGIIRRICMNLIGNSLKYTNKGFIEVLLEMELCRQNEEDKAFTTTSQPSHTMVLTVRDTGLGMSEEFLRSKLFLPYSQEAPNSDGLGLGLNMVNKLVKALAGVIEVQSSVGQGTTVTLRIPLQRDQSGSIQQQTSIASNQKTNTCTKTKYRVIGKGLLSKRRTLDQLHFYMREWYQAVEGDEHESVQWIFVDAKDYEECILPKNANLIIIFTDSLPQKTTKQSFAPGIQVLHSPIAPQKLSRVLTVNSEQEQAILSWPSVEVENESDQDSRRHLDTVKSGGQITISLQNQVQAQTLHKAGNHRDPRTSGHMSKEPNGTITKRKSIVSIETMAIEQDNEDAIRVLCVDDCAINLRLLVAYAAKLGLTHVRKATNGLEALQCVKEAPIPFDVIFMDITMPVMDGFTSTKRIRELELYRNATDGRAPKPETGSSHIARPIIVALTSLASTSDKQMAFDAGCDHFITKPLRYKDLQVFMKKIGLIQSMS